MFAENIVPGSISPFNNIEYSFEKGEDDNALCSLIEIGYNESNGLSLAGCRSQTP